MNAVTTTETRSVSPQQQFRSELDRMREEFGRALIGTGIPAEKFARVVTTAVLSDPAIMQADRKSLMESAMRAAQDGLLPDKREGAFVVFNTKVKIDGRDQWVKAVQWMPMIGGIFKKMHQSGEIAMVTAKVVYGGDTFRAWVDDAGEHVAYEQAELPDYDTIRQVFAMARTKEGAVYVETLTPRDIDKIRSVSRPKDSGPWVQWWEEMAKKSAIRRLAKRLPLAADLHDLLQRDNELYDLSRASDPRPSVMERLSAGRQQIALDAPGRPEGFDPAHVARETAAAAGGHALEYPDPASSLPSPEPGDAAGSPASPPVAADPSPAGGAGVQEADGPSSAPAPAGDPIKRMLMEECVDNMLRDAMSEPAEQQVAKIDKLRTIFLEPQNLGSYPDFVNRCAETARRIAGKPSEKARAREYLMSKVSA